MLKKNVGGIDRTLRIIIGVILVAVGTYFLNWWAIIGLILISTGMLSFCPLYLPFGISTDSKEDEEHEAG